MKPETPIADDTTAKARLLEAAGEIFADRGYHAATVRDICRAAGANVAAVNYYFGDKMGLYVEAVKYAHASRFGAPPPTWPEGTPPERKLYDFVHRMLSNLLDNSSPPWNAKLILRELVEPTDACRQMVEERIRPVAMVLMRVVAELLPPGTPAPKIHMTAFSVIGQCVFYRVQEHVARQLIGSEAFDALTINQVARHITGLTLAAIGRSLPEDIP